MHPRFALPSALLCALACQAVGSTARAQVDYSFNWHSANNGFLGGLGFVDGPGLFGALSGDGHFAGAGDSIRICYGIDDTQGGRHADGLSEITWFQLVGSYSASSQIPGLDFGLVSISTASVDSLEGDACFSPFFGQGIDSVSGAPVQLNIQTALAFVPGPISLSGAFPTFWFIYFDLLGSTGLQTRATLGLEPAGVGTFVDPLLTNLIFEVQGPLNFGSFQNQYYLAATSEQLGLGSGGTGTGGVTNGNGRQGFSISGLTADQSGAVAHSRLTALGSNGVLTGAFSFDFAGIGSTQWFGELATRTPALWAARDGGTGGGASDLSIGSSVSTFQWRFTDHLAGAQGNPLEPVYDPDLVANLALVLYSRTPAEGMLQTPMSWDTLFGNLPGRPGSIVLGQQPTLRAGAQTIPANYDALMAGFLVNQPAFTLGTSFTPSGFFEVPSAGVGGPGQSIMPLAQTIAAGPNPALVGTKLGLAGVGIQFDLERLELGLTEFANGMTLNLQP